MPSFSALTESGRGCLTAARALLLLGCVVLAHGAHGAGERPTEDAAKAFMTKLVDDAARALGDKSAALESRERGFRALLREGFDMPFIARVALGREWNQISDAERAVYTELFSEYVLKTYASRLGGFDPKRFHVTGASDKGRQDVVVETSIDQPEGGAIKAEWRVRLVEGKHKIVDIIVEGISMALNQRAEFTAVIQKDGVTGLIELLRARTETLTVEAPA